MAEMALSVVFFFAGITIGIFLGLAMSTQALKSVLQESGLTEALRELKSLQS